MFLFIYKQIWWVIELGSNTSWVYLSLVQPPFWGPPEAPYNSSKTFNHGALQCHPYCMVWHNFEWNPSLLNWMHKKMLKGLLHSVRGLKQVKRNGQLWWGVKYLSTILIFVIHKTFFRNLLKFYWPFRKFSLVDKENYFWPICWSALAQPFH